MGFNAIETRCCLKVKYEVVAGESDDTRNEPRRRSPPVTHFMLSIMVALLRGEIYGKARL